MNTPVLDAVLERVHTLPHLRDAVLYMVRVVTDPNSSLSQIVEAIRYDPPLTAELLRLCNSAYYGVSRQIESLDDAVRLLGTTKVFQLAMAAYARTMLGGAQEGYGLPAGALWTHSVTVAIAARCLARRMGVPQAGLLFTAGLLHDCGKVVLNEFVRREYAQIVRRVTEEHLSFSEVEQQVLGYTHAEVGARLAETWKLPPSLVECIRYHHEPEDVAAAQPAVDAVHLADVVALLLGVGGGDDGLSYRASAQALGRHGLVESDLENAGAEAIGELRSVQALFAVQ
jgi:putative nucleotidyltransferase with HDIG domain